MPQRPVKPFEIRRRPPTPEIPPASNPGGNAVPSDSPHVVWRDPADADRAETAPAPGAPTVGESLPDTSGGRVCQRCGAYVVLPEVHADFHRNLDRHIRLTLDVFQVRGYITKGGDTATDGDGQE